MFAQAALPYAEGQTCTTVKERHKVQEEDRLRLQPERMGLVPPQRGS